MKETSLRPLHQAEDPAEVDDAIRRASARHHSFEAWKLAPWAIGALVLGAVILAALHFAEIGEILKLLRSARLEWLAVALLAQVTTFVCATAVWRLALNRAGSPLPLRQLVPLGVAKLLMDQVIPAAGIGGATFVVRALARRQVPASAVMTALIVGLISFYAAYLIVVIAALIIMWLHHQLNPAALLAGTVFSSLAVGAPCLLLYLTRLRKRPLPRWVLRLPGVAPIAAALDHPPVDVLKTPRLIGEAVLLQLCIFFLDALTLWIAFQAIGRPVGPLVAFSAFAMASVAGTIGLVPLGLGTFEAGAVGTLSLQGVPVDAALAAVLLLRLFTFWLPMLPGLWIARREISARRDLA
jgi:uncharacterized membrane protein YbhN (UPF0104 family)